MEEYVIQIDFIDRANLGYDIFILMERKGIDKIAMKVLSQQARELNKTLALVKGVTAVNFRDQMPYEEREDELKTILNHFTVWADMGRNRSVTGTVSDEISILS